MLSPTGLKILPTPPVGCLSRNRASGIPPPGTTVAQTEAMHQMRQGGATLEQVASAFGISREAVRQLLTEHYGSTRVQELLSTTELCRLAGSSYNYIDKLKRRGIIQPAMVVGRGRTLWPPATIATIIIYIDRHRCPVCQQPVPTNRQVYSSRECYIKANREAHRYKNKTELAKRQHNDRVKRWIANHPEQAKEIEQRKAKKYQARKSAERYQNTRYQISRKCPIPLGTVVRVVSGNKGKLNVEWDGQVVELPFGCVRRVRVLDKG